MEKARLLELVKQHNDKEAIGMILSNFTDYGHTEKGGMISVGQFYKVAECLIEWWAGKNKPSEKEVLPLYNVMPCYLLQKVDEMYYGAYSPVKLFKTEKEAVDYALDNDILNYTIDEMSF